MELHTKQLQICMSSATAAQLWALQNAYTGRFLKMVISKKKGF